MRTVILLLMKIEGDLIGEKDGKRKTTSNRMEGQKVKSLK